MKIYCDRNFIKLHFYEISQIKLHWKFQVNHFFIIKSYLDLTHKFLSINYNLPYCIENTPFISLNDYIASISFDTDEVQCFYPPVGEIPKECIDFTVIDEVLIPKRSFVYSEKDGVLYHYPLTNVYEDGRICWGNLKIPACMSVSDMKRAIDFLMHLIQLIHINKIM